MSFFELLRVKFVSDFLAINLEFSETSFQIAVQDYPTTLVILLIYKRHSLLYSEKAIENFRLL